VCCEECQRAASNRGPGVHRAAPPQSSPARRQCDICVSAALESRGPQLKADDLCTSQLGTAEPQTA
jgi:hypothetical protein